MNSFVNILIYVQLYIHYIQYVFKIFELGSVLGYFVILLVAKENFPACISCGSSKIDEYEDFVQGY